MSRPKRLPRSCADMLLRRRLCSISGIACCIICLSYYLINQSQQVLKDSSLRASSQYLSLTLRLGHTDSQVYRNYDIKDKSQPSYDYKPEDEGVIQGDENGVHQSPNHIKNNIINTKKKKKKERCKNKGPKCRRNRFIDHPEAFLSLDDYPEYSSSSNKEKINNRSNTTFSSFQEPIQPLLDINGYAMMGLYFYSNTFHFYEYRFLELKFYLIIYWKHKGFYRLKELF